MCFVNLYPSYTATFFKMYCMYYFLCSVSKQLLSAGSKCEAFSTQTHSAEHHQPHCLTHQSAQKFAAKGWAAAVFHGESHLVDQLLQPIHTLQGLTGHFTEYQEPHTHLNTIYEEVFCKADTKHMRPLLINMNKQWKCRMCAHYRCFQVMSG